MITVGVLVLNIVARVMFRHRASIDTVSPWTRKSNPRVSEQIKISVRDLNFFYGGFHALKDINLDIPENKVTAFIGPSGCGKSTLLRVFNRMFELYPEQRAEGQVSARRRGRAAVASSTSA